MPLDQDSATSSQPLVWRPQPRCGEQIHAVKTHNTASGIGWYLTADASRQDELQTPSALSSAQHGKEASDKSTCQEPAAHPDVDKDSFCHSHVTY